MDPITTAIVVALGRLGENVIKDAYDALKAAIAKKYGVNSDLAEEIEKLEKKPTSTARKESLKEEVAAAKADKDPEILRLAQTLLDKVHDQPGSASTIINQQAGDNSIQIGQVTGNANIKR